MGVCLENRNKRQRLIPEEIVENINNLFKNMSIRSSDINDLTTRITSNQLSNNEDWKNFTKKEFANPNYEQTINDLVNEAFKVASVSFGDETLLLMSLLFLANSDVDKFVTSFQSLNLARKAKGAGNEIMNVVDAGMKKGLFAGLVTGLNAIQNVSGAMSQVSNPNTMRKYDLKNLIFYYINLMTLLPVNLLRKNNEGNIMKEYYYTVLNSAFDKKIQKSFIDEMFKSYPEEINIKDFFRENLTILKEDSDLRKDLVTNYVNNLKEEDIKIIMK